MPDTEYTWSVCSISLAPSPSNLWIPKIVRLPAGPLHIPLQNGFYSHEFVCCIQVYLGHQIPSGRESHHFTAGKAAFHSACVLNISFWLPHTSDGAHQSLLTRSSPLTRLKEHYLAQPQCATKERYSVKIPTNTRLSLLKLSVTQVPSTVQIIICTLLRVINLYEWNVWFFLQN